jgi:hypothetical protein
MVFVSSLATNDGLYCGVYCPNELALSLPSVVNPPGKLMTGAKVWYNGAKHELARGHSSRLFPEQPNVRPPVRYPVNTRISPFLPELATPELVVNECSGVAADLRM